MSKKCRGAGRPRCFDAEKVLDAASRLFWKNGYSATSVSDLSEATGLNKGSLYSSFGDKHTLFLKCLDRYLNHQLQLVSEKLHDTDPIVGLQRCFESLAFSHKSETPCGCLAVNTLTELAPHDEEIKKLLDTHIREIETLVGQVIEQVNRPSPLSPAEAARTFCSLALATRARSRSGEPDLIDAKMTQLALKLLFPEGLASTSHSVTA